MKLTAAILAAVLSLLIGWYLGRLQRATWDDWDQLDDERRRQLRDGQRIAFEDEDGVQAWDPPVIPWPASVHDVGAWPPR